MMVLKVNFAAVLLAAGALGLLSVPARGGPNTVLKVQIGWGDRVRAGHWTPIFIQATDPMPQAASVEINAPQGSLYAMQVRQYFTISPIPSTLTLFVPMATGWGDGPAVVIRDDHDKTMARYPPDPENDNFYQHIVNGNTRLIGVSGQHTSLQNMQGQVPGVPWDVAYLEPELLPITPVGYESLDLLVLNEPDLLHLRGEQQQAIVDWVRGGGDLLLWPGEDPAPSHGPLIDALPCTIAASHTVNLTVHELARLGLPRRFAGIHGRALVPRAGAEAVDLFGIGNTSQDVAYRGRLGLGSILVAPVNLSQLQFESPANEFWTNLLAGTPVIPTANEDNTSYNNLDSYTRRQYNSSQSLEDFLGNVPGAGKFGFSYVALVLLGMMVVVGPVDWFVLRKLGRQPWTWLTTTGWIILISGGALFIGHIFKSGKLHYGTIRVIDQAGGSIVGETSLTGIYSPRTTSYHLDAVPSDVPAPDAAGVTPTAAATFSPPPGWWSVASTEEYGSRHGAANDMSFHQTDEGNAPEEMYINVWNLRFLREETTRAGAPMIDATLTYTSSGTNGRPHINGVIRNLTGKPLTNVRIRVKDGVASPIARIEPNGSINVDASLDANPNGVFSEAPVNQYNPYGYNNAKNVMPAGDLWHIAGDISAIRTRRIESLLKTEGMACIYAECPGCEPPANLREAANGAADQQHYEFIRALVPITRGYSPQRSGDTQLLPLYVPTRPSHDPR